MEESRVQIVNGYFICDAENHHLPALNAIELAAATLFPPESLPEYIFTDCLPRHVLETAKNEQSLWVAVQHHENLQEHPAGYVMVQEVDGLALVAQMDVHPQHGRKGLGTALLAHAIHQVRESGFTALYLTTFSNVRWNAPFYEKMGFVIMDEMDLPRPIAEILCKERACGLRNRVGMRLSFVTH